MPADAPGVKIANTRALGGEVILYDRRTESRESIGLALATERGLTVVRPYDDSRIIAGQGTAGLEAARQAEALGLRVDQAVVPASGGGLIAGVALGVHGIFPDCTVWSAEPNGFDDLRLSLDAGRPVPHHGAGSTLCDALLAAQPGDIPFAVHRDHLTGGVALDDSAVLSAMRTAFDRLKIVLEPGGAIALAAMLSGAVPGRARVTLVIASGGNVDPTTCIRALNAPPLA